MSHRQKLRDQTQQRAEGKGWRVRKSGLRAQAVARPRVQCDRHQGSSCSWTVAQCVTRAGAQWVPEIRRRLLELKASMCFADILCSYLSSFWGVLHAHPPALGSPEACSAGLEPPEPSASCWPACEAALGEFPGQAGSPGPASSWDHLPEEALCDVYDLSLTVTLIQTSCRWKTEKHVEGNSKPLFAACPGPAPRSLAPSSLVCRGVMFLVVEERHAGRRPRPSQGISGAPAAHSPAVPASSPPLAAPSRPQKVSVPDVPLTSYIPKLPFDIHTHRPCALGAEDTERRAPPWELRPGHTCAGGGSAAGHRPGQHLTPPHSLE